MINCFTPYFSVCLSSYACSGDWTQGLEHSRQMVYHWVTLLNLVCMCIFLKWLLKFYRKFCFETQTEVMETYFKNNMLLGIDKLVQVIALLYNRVFHEEVHANKDWPTNFKTALKAREKPGTIFALQLAYCQLFSCWVGTSVKYAWNLV